MDAQWKKWHALINDWRDCKMCPLGKLACKHVFGRGDIEADILFIGEAPGKSEDILGEPFVGRAGRFLDNAIAKALDGRKVRIFFTNVVACRPTDEMGGANRQPSEQEKWTCHPRLERTIKIVNPNKIVTLGMVAKEFISRQKWRVKFKLDHAIHPAALLRSGGEKSERYGEYVKELERVLT